MARRGRGRPKVHYPLGRVQHGNRTTERSYGFGVRQTKHGRVLANPADLGAYLEARRVHRETVRTKKHPR